MRVAEVLLDRALDHPLDYQIPEDIPVEVGHRVEVPLQGHKALGTILRLKEKSHHKNVRYISRTLGKDPHITPDLFRLSIWIAKYYRSPLQRVLKAALPPVVHKGDMGHKTQKMIKPLLSKPETKALCENLRQKSGARARVLDVVLKKFQGLLLTELLDLSGVSRAPIEALVKMGALKMLEAEVERSPILTTDFFPTKPKTLNNSQAKTLSAIVESLDNFQTHLIFGVTGSGKTEVYLQAIDATLKTGKGVIYLVPEISLTSQTIERFKGRFGDKEIAVLHSRLSAGERYDAWHKIASGKAKIVIGARSAIFSPVPNLGMIIVDEEHESSYKQSEELPKYHARDVAVVRAKFANCPVILGSATPSLESYTNAKAGKYLLHTLNMRADSAELPTVTIVDMEREFEQTKGFVLFSNPLIEAIKKRITLGEQILLFLNRRGYHTSAQCTSCTYVVRCPHCELSLTYHLGDKILACHLCNYHISPPRSCPECQKEGPLKFRGAGTELVERSLRALLPDVRSLRLDTDTTKHKGSHEKIFRAFRSGKADVLIGTQMIAKGLHFPLVTLVGVLGSDGSLNIPDFRASENVFQLLTQVAGRSGRGDLKGEVLIQTKIPKHPLIQLAANQDYEGFYEQEIETRRAFGYPPFTHLIKIGFSSKNQQLCVERGEKIRKALLQILPKEVEIYPVVPCGYAKIKDRYRYQCLVKGERVQMILQKIGEVSTPFEKRKDVRLTIEVDPLSTFF